MSSDEILKLVLTASAGAVAKELIQWLVGLVKGASAFTSTKAKLQWVFSKSNRAVIFDLMHIVVYAGFLAFYVRRDGATTKIDVLVIVGLVIYLLMLLFVLLGDIIKILVAKDRATNPFKGS